MKKNLKNALKKVESDLIHIIQENYVNEVEDRIIHDMLYSIEQIRDAKLDIAELKLLNSALKELRHSLKIFKEYFTMKKAAVFGSARTPRNHPDYKIAKKFGQLMAKKDWSCHHRGR